MKREGGKARGDRWGKGEGSRRWGEQEEWRWEEIYNLFQRARGHDGKHSRNPECLLRGVCLPPNYVKMCDLRSCGCWGGSYSESHDESVNKTATHSQSPLRLVSADKVLALKAFCVLVMWRPVITEKSEHCELWDDSQVTLRLCDPVSPTPS